MEHIETALLAANDTGLESAARLLRAGGLVGFATETVYGLGGNARDGRAVARIYAAKGRPQFNPLIVHVPDLEAAQALARFDDTALKLARALWPGPLTLVLPRRDDAGLSDLISAGLDTVAIRVPAHPLARALLRRAGVPVAAPSANPSGRISPTTAQHVMDGLAGRIDAVLDGGPCDVGVESTILGLAVGPVLLRAGGIDVETLTRLLGTPPARHRGNGTLTSPGQMASHYAPRGTMRLNAETAHADEVLLGFGPVGAALNLSPTGDLVEAAANLFAHLHTLDAMDAAHIAVSPIPRHGLGAAINDRLNRAAAPRP